MDAEGGHLSTLVDINNRQKHTDVNDDAEPLLVEFCDVTAATEDTPTPIPTAADTDVKEFVTFGNTVLFPTMLGATTVPFIIFGGVTADKLLMEELLRFATLAMFVTGGDDTIELLRLNTWG
jgi:hypothetical protein